jgi:hypothetical protein
MAMFLKKMSHVCPLVSKCLYMILSCYSGLVLTVYIRVKVQVDLQADKPPVVVKGPFFPRVVNPRYRIRGTNV